MSNFLRGKKVYLSGPIEFGSEKDWRSDPKSILFNRYQLDVFDPFNDPKQQFLLSLINARENKDYELMHKIAKRFVRKDLGTVDATQIVIAYVPYKVPTVGTTHEIINSNNSKKPTLLVTDQKDISYIPLWYYGFIKHEFMFAGWDALYDYLDSVDRGDHRDNDRWSLVYNDI